MEIKGIIAALVTPMHEDESINTAELARQVRRQIGAGIHGLFCLGTNGEGYILSTAEKEAVIDTTVRTAQGSVPVYAGTGCVGTRETVALSRRAQALGADALSVVCPYFAVASQDALYGHFMAVADAVDIPVLLYNIPARTGVSLLPATVGRLARHPNIRGIKDSSGNFDLILQYIEGAPEGFAVLSGNDSLVLWTLAAGGQGGICGMANLFPALMVSIYEHFIAGRATEAATAQRSLRPIRDSLALGNPNSIVKLAMGLLDHPVGPCRKPFDAVSEAARAEVGRVLDGRYGDVR